MAISIVQSATGSAVNGTSFTITFSTAPTAGNKLLLITSVATYQDATREASVTGFAADSRLVNVNSSMMVLSKTAGSGEDTSYTVNISGTVNYHSGIMYEIAGADNDNFYNALALAASLTTPSRTPTVIGVLPIAALTTDNRPFLTAPSGWSDLIAVRPQYHATYAVSQALGTDTSTSYSAVWGDGVDPTSAIILVNPPGGGGGTVLPVFMNQYRQRRA